MGFINKEDVVAYRVGERILCTNCHTDFFEAIEYYTKQQFLLQMSYDIVVCDKCGTTIWRTSN